MKKYLLELFLILFRIILDTAHFYVYADNFFYGDILPFVRAFEVSLF